MAELMTTVSVRVATLPLRVTTLYISVKISHQCQYALLLPRVTVMNEWKSQSNFQRLMFLHMLDYISANTVLFGYCTSLAKYHNYSEELGQEHRGGSNFMNACDRNVQRVKLTERIWGLSLSLAFKRSWQAGVSCAAPTEGSVQTICYQ